MLKEKIKDYIASMSISDSYNDNFNSFVKFCFYLNECEIQDEFDICHGIISSSSVIRKIVKGIVENNMGVITHGNISSLNSNSFFVQFIEIYCMLNGIDTFEDNKIYDNLSDDVNNRYFNEIRGIPVLSREEEYRLFKMYESGDSKTKKYISDKIIKHNLKLVVKIARRFVGCGMQYDDLIGEGNAGLIRAVELFDLSRDYKFSTYASKCIKSSIQRAITDKTRNIRLPYYMQEKMNLYNKVVNDYKMETGFNPSIEVLMDRTRLSYSDLVLIESYINDTLSLDETITNDEDSDTDKYNYISDPSVSIEDDYDKKELYSSLLKVFNDLHFTSRQIDIFVLYYGLNGNREHTLEEIGEKYGITRERVRQIMMKLLIKIRYNRNCIRDLCGFMPNSEEAFSDVCGRRKRR